MIAFLIDIENEKARSKLEELYLEYHKDMFITAYSILKDYQEAEDRVQDAIIRLSKNLNKISDIKCKKTRFYLVTIVRNLSLNSYNKRKNITLLEHEEVKRLSDDQDTLIEKHMIKLDLSNEIAMGLAKLHQSYADILTLRYYYELTISQIADILNITENNVSVRLSRAQASLKSILGKEGVMQIDFNSDGEYTHSVICVDKSNEKFAQHTSNIYRYYDDYGGTKRFYNPTYFRVYD